MAQIRIDVIIPTYKPDKKLLDLIAALQKQTVKPAGIILVNTEEKYLNSLFYGTDYLKKYPQIRIKNISKREFNHGKTRNQGAKRSDAEIMVFMTQDAMPADEHTIEELIRPMTDKEVIVSYARQIAYPDANPIETFSRQFNYPDKPMVKSEEDLPELGVKTYFCSNVCAAYKKYAFDELGGFINFTIFNEDMLFAAKAIKNGKKVAYAANAKVLHSHNYSGIRQLHRNFDLGVSQVDHPEVFADVKSESEGMKYAKETMAYLWSEKKAYLIPKFIYQCGCRLLGYKLGRNYKKLNKKTILKLTANRTYWYRYWDKNEIPVNVYAGYGKTEEENNRSRRDDPSKAQLSQK